MFSPWRYNIDAAAARLLAGSGWTPPDAEHCPTGGELRHDYLVPLATRTPLREAVRLNAAVASIGRQGFDKVRTAGRDAAAFSVHYRDGRGEHRLLADAVIDASGTWSNPSPAGPGGLDAPGEAQAAGRISHGMPDVLGAARRRFAGRRVAVLGGGHSAVGTLLALADLKSDHPATAITWLYRGATLARALGGGAADQLSARGELGTRIAALAASGRITVETGFQLAEIAPAPDGLSLTPADAPGRTVIADELVVATGFRPDLSLFRELRIALDPALECPPALAPLIDPNEHSCGTVRPHGAAELAHPETGFYIAGMKSYGRAPTFLLATGHEQARSIVAAIAGDHEAARRVELVLPETGVCSASPPPASQAGAAAGCCGGPPPLSAPDACCVADAAAKSQGAAGCGYGRAATPARETADA
jgi:thioredoxin reductase